MKLSIYLILFNLIYPISSIRQLIDFQVYEEDNVFKSKLNVNSLIDVNGELRFKDDLSDVYDGSIEMRSPIPMKIDVKLRKIKKSEKGNESNEIYKLNLNVDEQYRLELDVDHRKEDGNHQFISDLDFNSIDNDFSAKYLNTIRYNEKKCPKLTLYHNLTTNFDKLIQFSSNLTEQCNQTNLNNQTEDEMKITINFSNLINDLFDFKLDQIFSKQTNKGSESMKLLNKIYKIDVYGDYRFLNDRLNPDDEKSDLKYQFFKKAVFKSSLPSQFPTFVIKYVHDDEDENKIKLSFEIKNEFYKKSLHQQCDKISS